MALLQPLPPALQLAGALAGLDERVPGGRQPEAADDRRRRPQPRLRARLRGGVRAQARRDATQAGAFRGADPERSAYKKSAYFFVSTTPTKKYSIFAFGSYTAGAFDYDFGAGPRFPRVSPAALSNPFAPLDPGPGDMPDFNGSFKYQPSDALSVSLDYTKSRLVRRDTGRVAFDANIYTVRSTYQFTRFTFARARLDYDTLVARMRGQFLVGWAPSPGTSFYVGYNDDLNRNGFNPYTGALEPGLERNRRTFFVKMSYLFRRGF